MTRPPNPAPRTRAKAKAKAVEMWAPTYADEGKRVAPHCRLLFLTKREAVRDGFRKPIRVRIEPIARRR